MRIATVAIAALCLTTPLAAQDKATILEDWARTRTNLLAYIDAAPDSMLSFRPTPGVRTFAQQVDHILETNVDVAAQSVRNLPRSPVLGDSARYLHDKAALRAYAAAAYDYALAAIREATPAQLARVSSIYRMPAAPAWRWVQLAQEHTIWTFGQLVPYLRLNGVTPPSYSIPL